MRRSVQAVAIVVMLLAAAAPVVAQTETALCLRVQAATDVDLTDAQVVQQGIGTGEIVVTEVVPCEGETAPMASTTPSSDTDTGAWIVQPIEFDASTDDQRASVSLKAESGTTWYGAPVQLTIWCADGNTEYAVSWGWDLGRGHLIDVSTQIGDGAWTTEAWFNDGSGTDYGGADTTFIESLFGEARLAHQVQPWNADIVTAVFDLTGIENAVAGVREACGW
jgi:type VI secretion system protein VasI